MYITPNVVFIILFGDICTYKPLDANYVEMLLLIKKPLSSQFYFLSIMPSTKYFFYKKDNKSIFLLTK
jgi:hypothetical protein